MNPSQLLLAACGAALAALAALVTAHGSYSSRLEAVQVPLPAVVAAPSAAIPADRPLAQDPAAKASVRAASLRAAPPRSADPEDQLAVDGFQHLIVNEALRATFDHYLLGHAGAGDKAELLAELRLRLPGPAFDAASLLLDRYIRYMQVHDAQLAARWSFAPLPDDLASLAGWLAQREQLRQSLLGVEATRAWFQNSNAQIQQALDELAQRQQGSASAGVAGSAPVPHWESATAEAAHVADLQQLLRSAVTSYRAQSQGAAIRTAGAP